MGTTIESIEEYIHFLKDNIGKGMANIIPTEFLENEEYNAILDNVNYASYIYSGDTHYFVSRTLFMHHVYHYSFFSAYQCIENYLKAFIRYKGHTPKLTHSLDRLLSKCKELALPSDEFFWSEQLSTIIYKYRPFLTSPRYPVSKEKFFSNATFYPDDIYVLDYFVYRFREMLPYPENRADILKGEHPVTFQCKENRPYFYQTFVEGNINFGK